MNANGNLDRQLGRTKGGGATGCLAGCYKSLLATKRLMKWIQRQEPGIICLNNL